MEAYRGRFEAAAVSRQLDSAEGITSGHILETEGDTLVSVDYPVVANAPDISAELKAFAENKLAEFRASADAAHGENKDGLCSLTMTYKPYVTEGNLLSIKFTTESELAGQAAAFFSAEGMVAVLIILSSAAVYAGAGFVVAPSKTAALGTLPPATYSAGASINSTAVQIASAIGSSLFVGVLSADVLRDTAAGAAKASAYAAAFEHTLSIAVVIAAAGLLVAFFYARAMRKPAGKQR